MSFPLFLWLQILPAFQATQPPYSKPYSTYEYLCYAAADDGRSRCAYDDSIGAYVCRELWVSIR